MCAKNNVLKALILGGVLGGTLGVLFAPKSGKETRDDIAKAYKKIHKDVSKKVEDMASLSYSQYEKIVKTIVDKYVELKNVSLEQAEVFKKRLLGEWKEAKKDKED